MLGAAPNPLLASYLPTTLFDQWYPIREGSVIVVVLTLWVFVCAFSRGSATYGEVAVSAALTVRVKLVWSLRPRGCLDARAALLLTLHTQHRRPLWWWGPY